MTSMLKQKKSLLHIERWRDRHGNMRVYFRCHRHKGCPRIELKGDYGSDEFLASYADALHGGEIEESRPKIERPGNGTLAVLIAFYKHDAAGEPKQRRDAGCRYSGLRTLDRAGVAATPIPAPALRFTVPWCGTGQRAISLGPGGAQMGGPVAIAGSMPCQPSLI
jgi:hypothetical protein